MALSSPRYSHFNEVERHHRLGVHHLACVIKLNDVDALREFIALKPGLLTWTDLDSGIPPPTVLAAELGHNEVLRVLLDYQATLLPSATHDIQSEVGDGFRRNYCNALTAACGAAHLSTMQILLGCQPQVDLEERDQFDRTALLSALGCRGTWGEEPDQIVTWSEEREQIVRQLLDLGADARAVCHTRCGYERYISDTVLTLAMVSASPRIITWLVEAGAEVRAQVHHFGGHLTPLHIGCLYHNVSGIKTLLNLGAQADITTGDDRMNWLPLHAALLKTHDRRGWKSPRVAETIALLLADDKVREATINAKDADGCTPLHLAANINRVSLIPALLDRGADLSICDAKGRTPLHTLYASVPRHSLDPSIENEIDAALVFLLPDDEVRKVIINAPDANGQTPLHLAAHLGRVRPLRALLSRGAGSSIRDAQGRTPLHILLASVPKIYLGSKAEAEADINESVVLLVKDKAGEATINAADASGYTPLHLAARFPGVSRSRRIAVIRTLLNHGADAAICDADGQTPLHTLCASVAKYTGTGLDSEMDEELLRALTTCKLPVRAAESQEQREASASEAPMLERMTTSLQHETSGSDESQEVENHPSTSTIVNQPDSHGNTSLHIAAAAWLERTIQVLVKLGARADVRNDAGETPVHLGAQTSELSEEYHDWVILAAQQERVLELLTAAGGDLDARDGTGATARDILERGRADRQREQDLRDRLQALRAERDQEIARIEALPREEALREWEGSKWKAPDPSPEFGGFRRPRGLGRGCWRGIDERT
ncbi:ankyrin repeat-containing domain protein [Diplogelasinospora grovesii]|uniref:Ankyrin repeat-containing domain protein n=1 Tax=Diplogelasinospora grovesii TaxID=303347 RepID=A0AAN6NF68_9PEZI|nr:ankyrin repeat-containing domain protein [Diplogelasinospora grovesii]